MALTDYDKSLIAGEMGPAAQMAMKIINRMQEVYSVDCLMDISAAHIDSTVYMGEATMEFAEKLASMGAKVVVPSTLNVSGVDEHGWNEWNVPAEHAQKAYRQMVAYESMGCIPTWTCAPYQTEHAPVFGQQVAAGESNAIAYFNSVIGARTERYPDLLDICCAITGRVPMTGLHLDEHRRGQYVLRLSDDVTEEMMQSDAFYPVLGHIMGKTSAQRIPVVEGLRSNPSHDQLKATCAAAATSGAVALFHLVGITPEAPTIEDAFQGPVPRPELDIDADALRRAYRELITLNPGESIEMILLGSPHFSVSEFQALATLVAGQKRNDDVEVVVTCSRLVRDIVNSSETGNILKQFGVRITVDTCPLTSPMLSEDQKNIMTNSAKYALYSPGLLNAAVGFGDLEECVMSAVSGRYHTKGDLWN